MLVGGRGGIYTKNFGENRCVTQKELGKYCLANAWLEPFVCLQVAEKQKELYILEIFMSPPDAVNNHSFALV